MNFLSNKHRQSIQSPRYAVIVGHSENIKYRVSDWLKTIDISQQWSEYKRSRMAQYVVTSMLENAEDFEDLDVFDIPIAMLDWCTKEFSRLDSGGKIDKLVDNLK